VIKSEVQPVALTRHRLRHRGKNRTPARVSGLPYVLIIALKRPGGLAHRRNACSDRDSRECGRVDVPSAHRISR
jgi:hypothetical protein